MKNDYLKYGVGLKSNKETNDFLRCLWSRLATKFGKIAWHYSPIRTGNNIYVGRVDLGKGIVFDVSLLYKQRGCLSAILFKPNSTFELKNLNDLLKKSVSEALSPEKYIHQEIYKVKLDKNISFQKKESKNFTIEGNNIRLKIFGFDENDCVSMCKIQLQQVCNLLTFDTLRYITMSGTLTEEIREKHNFIATLENKETGEVADKMEKKDMYRDLIVSDNMAEYIDSYLERPYEYENHFTNLEKSVQLFAQGIKYEELSKIAVGFSEPYAEQAILHYMSALEVITLNDKKPEQCKCCGQMRYSIARRVIDLANSAIKELGEYVKEYYEDRSKYVHTGLLFSSNNYIGQSIPLMSKSSKTGMIMQHSVVVNDLKEMIKACIEWHEKFNAQ